MLGIDPSKDSVHELKMKGINGWQGSIYDMNTPRWEQSADVVFLVDVLEHLLEPDKAVSNIWDILRENGIVFLSVPDYGNLYEDNTPIANNFNSEHINYFSDMVLDQLFTVQGFENIFSCKKKIKAAQGYIYSQWKLYRKKERNREINYKYSVEPAKSIREYIGRKEEEAKAVNQKLKDILTLKKKCIIWGMGSLAMQLLAESDLAKCDVVFAIDNNPSKQGKVIGGIMIKGAEDALADISENMTIIICCMLDSANIVESIHRLGLRNDVVLL